MSPKLLARLKASLSRTSVQGSAPEYSRNDPNPPLTSPSYEEVLAQDARGQRAQRMPLVRTISGSSHTSSEFSAWLDSADKVETTHNEELPAYQEYPQIPMLSRNISTLSATRPQPHAMCPCAQCHRLRWNHTGELNHKRLQGTELIVSVSAISQKARNPFACQIIECWSYWSDHLPRNWKAHPSGQKFSNMSTNSRGKLRLSLDQQDIKEVHDGSSRNNVKD